MFLEPSFVEGYRARVVPWGFPSGPNSLGELVYRRTYRRDGADWADTVRRVTEGTFEVLFDHCDGHNLPFDFDLARFDACDFFDRLFHFKWTPPGRGLWMMGTDYVRLRGSMPLQSCAFVSTKDVDKEFDKPFRFLMDVSMLGTGCGFDTRGAGKVRWQPFSTQRVDVTIADSREGWVDSVGRLLRWGFGSGPEPFFAYNLIRPRGTPIKGFGGTCEGPDALRELHEGLRSLIKRRAGHLLSSRDVVDVMNMIGACVVAGNVRRTAEIAFGEPEDEDFLDLKDYDKFPERSEYGWTSNNSIYARVGMDYTKPAARTRKKGEPGYAWLENMRAFGRMCEPANHKDRRVLGGNPCTPAGTLVLTRKGHLPIETLLGTEVEVWNGKEWSKVVTRITGHDQPLVKVTLSDGRSLRCTPNHEWCLLHPTIGEVRKRAWELVNGDTVYPHPVAIIRDNGVVDIPSGKHATVTSVEPCGFASVVYCFTEPKAHRGTFDGIVTGQCLEQSLEHYEVCTLVETFPARHESLEDFTRTLKYAFLYAKAVTLVPTHWEETNAVVMRNRRIGCSVSGVAQFIARRGKDALSGWLDEGYRTVSHYDRAYSEWLGVRESIKKTSVKPSGTVSLLAGATPGAHHPEYAYFIRRVRYADTHPDLPAIVAAGYHTEPDASSANTTVVEFPVMGDPDVPTQDQVPLRAKVQLAADLQYVWADNQVSYTATFDPETEGDQIAPILEQFQARLKGISFLPRTKEGAYPQMPYEAITRERYEELVARLRPIVWPDRESHDSDDKYCDGMACEVAR